MTIEGALEAIARVRGQLAIMADRAEGPESAKLDQMGWTLGEAMAALGGPEPGAGATGGSSCRTW